MMIIKIGKFYFRTLFRYFRTLPVGGEVAAACERLLGVCENNEKVCGNKIFLNLNENDFIILSIRIHVHDIRHTYPQNPTGDPNGDRPY